MHRKEFLSPHFFMTTQVYSPASTFLTLFFFNHLYILKFIRSYDLNAETFYYPFSDDMKTLLQLPLPIASS